MSNAKSTGPRSIAIVGTYSSGKTTLLESLLYVTEATNRKGSVTQGNTVGDSAAEARARGMSTEVNVAATRYLDDRFVFLDCPGSIELEQEALNVLPGVDAAIVVWEAGAANAVALMPVMKALEEQGIPRMIFVNKVDRATGDAQSVLDALAPVSAAPLVLRHMPIVENETVVGYVDLASERTYVYRTDAESERSETPDAEPDARYQMLETLADFDDALMEKVLEDESPERDEVYANLTRDFADGLIVPVFLGAAEHDHGVRRLMKALRHEVPDASAAAARAGVPEDAGCVAQVLKTYHTQHGGKLSVARVWSGTLSEGMVLNGDRVSGVFSMRGHDSEKLSAAEAGDVVALGRMESVQTGDILAEGAAPALPRAELLPPVYAFALATERRDDEVKLSAALAKIGEEDPAIRYGHDPDTHEFVLSGRGEIHIKLAADRLANKYGIPVTLAPPRVPYKEAIKKGTQQHGRHKKQSGGHGQFGDVHLEIKPLPRGSGFTFENKIVGGAVPKQYIPAVEDGVRDYLVRGPLGFPVVDVHVTLYDGQFHAVDSSEIAFKTAAQIAMREGMPNCSPVLLEPILSVELAVPSEYTPKVNQLVSGRRGQILGFDSREGWPGWDVVTAHVPQSEMHDLIIELRSLSQGVGSFVYRFERLQELSGRLADQVVEEARAEAA